LGGEDLVRANVFGDEITSGRDNWSYIKKFQFTLLFKNNPTYYKDAFFILVSFLLFLYAMYKWTLLLANNPQLINWGIGIAIFSFILYVIVFVINRRIGAKLRNKEREKAQRERQKQGLSDEDTQA
jgi:Ca2+/Na+ antiporter